MAEVKLTKNELRLQQTRLGELLKYLPTLQLKKAMLQTEVTGARAEVVQCEQNYQNMHSRIETYSSLINEKLSFNLEEAVVVKEVQKSYENIAGTEVPYFKSISFNDIQYQLFDTPPWVDSLIVGLRGLVEASVRIQIAQEKKAALEEELRDVSIKVNLFEKILIPRAQVNIRKIKVFLGDQQLAAVSQAKVAKRKIEERKAMQSKPQTENAHAY